MADTASTQFYSALQQQALSAVSNVLNAPLEVIEYPQQGDFAWFWQNTSSVFNQQTYDYLTARVVPGSTPSSVALMGPGSFPQAYVQVLNSIMYSLSPTDQATLTNAQNNAAVQRTAIVTDYQNTYGPITSAQLVQAGYTDPVDYIVGYVLGSQWSGANPPLTFSQMAAARNLNVLLPKRPMSSDTVIGDVAVYLNLMQPALALQDELQNGTWTLAQLKNNAMNPSTANGGMLTFNPQTGAVSTVPNVGWTISQPPTSISNDLANTSRTIDVSMQTTSGSGNSLSVQVEGGAAFSVGDLLTFSTSVGGSYDMSNVNGTSTECSVDISYAGYSIVPAGPLAWQQATDIGFYLPDPIWQAVQNQGQEVTGFTFVSPPPFQLGPVDAGGNLGVLTALLVSNYPTVTITYQHADFSAFQQAWSETATGNLTLFGVIKLGSFSEGVYSSQYKQGSDNSTFSVTFSASPAVTSVPQYQRTAYVIGGVVANPGAES